MARLRAELQALANALGIGDAVAMPGFCANPMAAMSRAAALVLTSHSEGFGNVLAEALACGCPVVSTDCPAGPREILDGGRYGRLVPVGDVDALAAALAATLDDPPDPQRLRARGYTFTVARAADAYLAQLLGDGATCA